MEHSSLLDYNDKTKKKEAFMLEQQVHYYALKSLETDYQQAVHEAGVEFVLGEVVLGSFLRVEDGNVERAARRLALYWKTRKDIFKERWLLPMTQTGTGALSPQQVQMLRTGVKAPALNGTVWITDLSRLPKDAREIDPAIIFYQASVAMHRGNSVPTIFFHVIQDDTSATRARPLAPEMAQKLNNCMPLKKCGRIIVANKFNPATNDLLGVLAIQQKKRSERNLRQVAEYVMGNSVRGTINALEEKGLDRAAIPVSMGGDYFYHQEFDGWIRMRLSIEGAMDGAPPIRNSCAASFVTTLAIQDFITGDTKDKSTLVPRKPGESREAFLARRNKVYSQRSYAKRRNGLQDLRSNYNALEQQNKVLRKENMELEGLVLQAQLLLNQIQETPCEWIQETHPSARQR